LKYDATGVAQRPMRSHSWKNQSLVGVANRLLRHIEADAAPAPHTPAYANSADLNFPTATHIPLSVVLVPMAPPLSVGYSFSWRMLPLAVITQRVIAGKGSALLWWSLPALARLGLALFSPQGAQTYGNTFFATLLLFIALALELLRYKQKGRQIRAAADLAPTSLPI